MDGFGIEACKSLYQRTDLRLRTTSCRPSCDGLNLKSNLAIDLAVLGLIVTRDKVDVTTE